MSLCEGNSEERGYMRVICVALVACLIGALVWTILPAKAAFECGTFEGNCSCRSSSGAEPKGKNAPPVPQQTPEPAPVPEDAPTGEGLPATPGAAGTPGPAGCAPGSELLGGKCVRYYATCRT